MDALMFLYRPLTPGAYYPGIPARHLTVGDYQKLSLKLQAVLDANEADIYVPYADADETEQERAEREQREREEAEAAREMERRKNRLIRGFEYDPFMEQVAAMPTKAEMTALQADVAAVADVPPRVAAVETATIGLPTVVTKNYTRHLSRYADLAAAIADLPNAGADGGEVRVDGEVDWAAIGTASIPSKIHLIGRGPGSTVLYSGTNPTAPMLEVDGASDVVIADMAFRLPSGGTGGTEGFPVSIVGDAANVLLDRIDGEGFNDTIHVDGSLGTAPGTVRSLTIRNARANASPSAYGMVFNHVDGLTIENSEAHENYLDGLKLREMTKNVKVVGGFYNNNGQVRVATGTGAGDGIDAFAGGDTFTIMGATFNENWGNGITIKTDALTRDEPETYGYVRDAQVIGVTCNDNRLGSGAGFYTMPGHFGGAAPLPMASNASFVGGEFRGNTNYGLLLGGRNMTVTSPMVRGNGLNGIFVADEALDVTIVAPVVIANSQQGAGTYSGVIVRGKGVAIRGGIVLGVDAEEVFSEADYSGMTVYHAYSVEIASTADRVYVDLDRSKYTTASTHTIRSFMTSGQCRIAHKASGRAFTYGGPGSTFFNETATTPADVWWVKLSGAPNSVTGWHRMSDPPRVTSLPAADSLNKGLMVTKDNGGASEDTLHICVQTGASMYAWKQVTLA